MNIPKPFLPISVKSENLSHTVSITGREYIFGADGFLNSAKAMGRELLSAPVRIVLSEDGSLPVWEDNYAENESESFIQRRKDNETVICGAKQTERFIINISNTVDYDGNIDINLKLMTTGVSFNEAYGLTAPKARRYALDKLWLEIPLKASECTLFHMYGNSEMKLCDGTVIPETTMSTSGRIPSKSAAMPFKPLLWLGNEECGFGWFAENNRNWQPSRDDKAMELVFEGDALILRVRLLDGHPRAWQQDVLKGNTLYRPIDFHFGFHITPVKEFPKNPYIHNAFHLGCGFVVKGSYADYLTEENRFDRLAEKGVTTLILHEKWNKCQNWFEISEPAAEQLKYICEQCHKRGIKVLTYFGFELSTLIPEWSELRKSVTATTNNELAGGYWRKPFQRDYKVCYASEYANIMADGIAMIMDTYHTDGVYLDGPAFPRYCDSTEHGCGWYDYDGKLRGSYPISALRSLFKRLYETVSSRGGEINTHTSGVFNFTVAPYIHQMWSGEVLQEDLMKGSTEDINLDYFRAEYIGRNIGVPVEFIAYENRPLWCFETALSICLIHGILPRPNNIGQPLEIMSGVWKILNTFPVDRSEFKPYWNNNTCSSDSKVKISYYKYVTCTGECELLAFVTNISSKQIDTVTVGFSENVSSATDLVNKENCGFSFSLSPYGHRILYLN